MFSLFVLNVSSQVTIGNGPTTNMIFDVLCNTWRPSGAPAYLDVNDLINDLAAMPTKVEDFDCQNPQICLGPIIVEDPILYNSPFQLSFTSCTNVLVYATIENLGFGDIFFTTASVSSGVSDGYIVVGTGIEGVNGLSSSFGFYSSAALPIPVNRGPVHVGTLGGVNIQTPKLLAVVADTLDGAYAQIGMPVIPSAGSIHAFSGQCHAIISRTGLSSYARIGHGSDLLTQPIPFATIDIITEDGILWVHAGTTFGNKANIGHVSNNNDLGGYISVIINDGDNNTDGDIDIKGGNGNLASIGHFSELDQSQFVSGNITVQAQGSITMSGGSQLGSDAMIGHYSGALDNPIQSVILVESIKGTTLNGGFFEAKAQIGHDANIVDVGTSPITVGSAGMISLFGQDNGPAVIGHKLDDNTGLINGGEINVQSGNLTLQSAFGSNGWTGIGHYDQAGISSIIGDIFITSNGGVNMDAGGSQSFSRIGHDALSKGGTIDIFSGGDIELTSGQFSNATASIICEDSVTVYTSQNIIMESNAANVLINSIYNQIDIAAIGEIKQQKIGTPMASIDILPFMNSDLTMRAGDDILLTQELTNASKVSIHTDYDYLLGDLWTSVPYFGGPFFLAGWDPLGGLASPPKSDDSYGMLLIDPNSTFFPLCNTFELFASNKNEVDGFPSFLNVGTFTMLDLSGVANRITIGDTQQATDSIEAIRQTVNNVTIENSTLNLDSIFIKADDTLKVKNTTINTTSGMTFIADNEAPVFPLISLGCLSITQSNLTSGVSGIRMYSQDRVSDNGAGGFGGSIFNGAAHSNCNTVCGTEEWVFYYPFGTSPAASSYTHKYKFPNIALAITNVNFDVECDREKVKIISHISENTTIDNLGIELSIDGRKWQHYKDWLSPFHTLSIETKHMTNNKYVRLVSEDLNGEKDYSEIRRLPCNLSSEVKIYPQPASNLLYIEDKESRQYTIFDLFGNVVLEGYSPIDVSSLKSGVYLIGNNTWDQPRKISVAR